MAVIGFAIGFFTLGLGFILGIAGLVVAFVFYILAASHLRTTFKDLAQKSGEQSFNTAGMLLWWGAILTIIFRRPYFDIHSVDFCGDRLLLYENNTATTIQFATTRVHATA